MFADQRADAIGAEIAELGHENEIQNIVSAVPLEVRESPGGAGRNLFFG
jgi:hypothetical protein